MSSYQSEYCLLVSRAGKTDIFPLTTEPGEIVFGYAPPHPECDLVLYDGLLEDNHGAILYKRADSNQGTQSGSRTNFYIKAYADSIQLREMPIPARDGVEIPLNLNDEIKVGRKYVLTFSGYRPQVSSHQQQAKLGLSDELKRETDPSIQLLQKYLGTKSRFFITHMPEIYHPSGSENDENNFVSSFLALFESIMIPWHWAIENYDLYVHPKSAPPEFLPWFAKWYGPIFWDESLTLNRQRNLLCRLPDLVRHRGTLAGLRDLLACYVSATVEIDDQIGGNQFIVQFSEANNSHADNQANINHASQNEFADAKKKKIQALIDWYKPVHTTYTIEFPVERST